MTHEKVVEVCHKYLDILTRDHKAVPQRCADRASPFGGTVAIEHVAWMCEQIPTFIKEGRVEKAMRWLGFIQGALWVAGVFTIGDMKADNMPAGATFVR